MFTLNRHVLPFCFAPLATLAAVLPLAASEAPGLRIAEENYPKAFFFRATEGQAANQSIPYARWDATFSRLMGIIGKALEEEVPGRSIRNIDFFTRFKQQHPRQIVLVHYNGNARDPRDEHERFFAGHWVYYNGARILADVPAEAGETDIRVSDPRLFRIGIGRYRTSNDDLGLCALDDQGRPDWRVSEQVQLISVDPKGKTIRVRRGCYGTAPRAFAADRAYAATHVTEGPWGKQSHLLWFYNYSTRGPRDAQGRSCGDVLASYIAELFSPRGRLAAFDGLEFDVLHNECHGGQGVRAPDCDADGRPDGGWHEGGNEYGRGVIEFCRTLRKQMGDGRLIMADGMSATNQRAFGLLNGIESEGFPHLRDFEMHDWSGGLNRHFFWSQNARPPVFNYINHKFNEPTGEPGGVRNPKLPFGVHRLVFAAGVFTDSAICYSFAPPDDADGEYGIWDELRMGNENRLGWLGKPAGPPARLALEQPDLLNGRGKPFRRGALQMEEDSSTASFHLRIKDVPTSGPDLFVSLTARAARRAGDPPEMARLARVKIDPAGAAKSVKPIQSKTPAGRNQPAGVMTWLNEKEFTAGFYFGHVTSSAVDLEIHVESVEPVWIGAITAHAHPDAIEREFEHGLVLANPSPHAYTFDLRARHPGRKFRRLRGTETQDAKANNGEAVGDRLTLGPKEGLFLVTE